MTEVDDGASICGSDGLCDEANLAEEDDPDEYDDEAACVS